MKEAWKEIKDFEGLYWISDLGHVKNKHGRILKPEYSSKGYACVILRKNGKNIKKRVHILVAQAFIPNPENLPEVNHKDENKVNNSAPNLEWCTHQENMRAYMKNHPIHSCGQRAVYCFDLDQEFPSASVAAVHLGITRSSIVKACRGQLSQAGGKLWCYVEDKSKKFTLR